MNEDTTLFADLTLLYLAREKEVSMKVKDIAPGNDDQRKAVFAKMGKSGYVPKSAHERRGFSDGLHGVSYIPDFDNKKQKKQYERGLKKGFQARDEYKKGKA